VNLKRCDKPVRSYKESLKEALEEQIPHVIETLKKAVEVYENPSKHYRQALIWAGEMLATYSRIAENFLEVIRVHKISTKYEDELKSLLQKAQEVI
jgi:CRISPR/Cas system-associated endonuclease Cas3-HD